MKKSKKMVSILGAVLTMGVLSACGGGTPRQPGTLSIMFYNGGYGDNWVKEIVDQYMEETGNIVEAVPDKTISSKAETNLASKNGSEYDIFISHDLNWQNFADRGLLANLDDLYESKTIEGDKFADRVLPAAKEISKYKAVRDSEEHYYKVCLTQGAGGFVYNEDLFASKGWTVPTTYAELTALCKTISETTIDGGSDKYIPFAWAGGGETRDYYWDYPIFEWWAEMDGIEAIEAWKTFKGADGTYAKGYDNFDPEGKYKNFKEAYKMWYDLVALNNNYSNKDAQGAQLTTAQDLFFSGKAAMIPYGQWAKYEIESAKRQDFTFNVRMMKTPRVSATNDYYNFMVGFGDSMIVAKNSPNLEVAKDFLRYMATKTACKTFVKEAQGPFLAFDYSNVDLTDIRAENSYIDSMYKILTECVNFSIASNSPITVANGDIEIQPWFGNTRYYKEAFVTPANNTPDIVFEKVYAAAKDAWARLCRNADVQ